MSEPITIPAGEGGYEIRAMKLGVGKNGKALFHPDTTTVEIDDEASGEFVLVRQCSDATCAEIAIDPAEWPALRRAIDFMITQCRDYP